ncbi:hypothetical protein BDV06DRAFT_232018 [Aspergillus oleicola]
MRVIDLDDHDGKKIKTAVLPRTSRKYDRTLIIFDRFLELHPAACFPPDIKSYKGFLELYARNTTRGFHVPESASITMKEYIILDLKTKLGLPDI